jgi:enoyl-CoA hydratase/carnithine racemase
MTKLFPFKNDRFSASIEKDIAHVRLHGDMGNRFSMDLIKNLTLIGEELAYKKGLRAIYLTAEGNDFCHGADLTDPALIRDIDESHESRLRLAKAGSKLISTWSSLPIPFIVAANGAVIGAGACLVTVADFRFATNDTRISFPEVDRGMYLSWGVLPHMIREYGMPITKLLALGGLALCPSDFPSGVFRVEDSKDFERAAHLWAKYIANKPPLSVRSITATIRELSEDQSFNDEQDLQRFARTAGSEDFVEAMSAWLEKRQGVFKGI